MHKISFMTGLAFALAFVLTAHWFRKYPPGKAALYSILIGSLFLPEMVAFKLPMFPEFTKQRVLNLALLFTVLNRPNLPKAERWIGWVVGLMFVSNFMTYRTNQDTITSGIVTMSGMVFRDGMYTFLADATSGVMATYLAMRCFRGERDILNWIRMLTGIGLVYALPLLWESRMSPQLHTHLYGYPAFDDFGQSMRWGGYRPVAFMAHGLAVSLFMMGTVVTAAVMSRYGMRIWRLSGSQAFWFLLLTTIWCKSTGTWIYMAIAVPMARYASAKTMHRTAMTLATIVMLYPFLRATQIFPVEWLLAQASKISADRMQSLQFRFDNEDVLLQRAMERPWFGWSTSFGRNNLFDDYGKMATTTDGAWIIALGGGGLMGMFIYLGVPVLAIFLCASRAKKIRDPRYRTMIAALNLYLAFTWIDILPNGQFTMMPFFLGGALCAMTKTLGSRAYNERVTEQQKDKARPPSVRAPGTAVVGPTG